MTDTTTPDTLVLAQQAVEVLKSHRAHLHAGAVEALIDLVYWRALEGRTLTNQLERVAKASGDPAPVPVLDAHPPAAPEGTPLERYRRSFKQFFGNGVGT